MICVFENPIHANGGCIFDDPAGLIITGGGTSKRSRRHVPGITGNRAIAMREDEEVLVMLEAYFNTKRH